MEPQQTQPPIQPLIENKNHKFLWILVPVFILLTLSGLLILKYQSDNHVSCIGVVTTAKNPQTGEIKTFGTPCEVPKGWSIVPEQVVDETANWKIYRNEEYGFEFKYSNLAKVEEVKQNNFFWVNLSFNDGMSSFVSVHPQEVCRDSRLQVYFTNKCDVKNITSDYISTHQNILNKGIYYMGEVSVGNKKAVSLVSCNIGCSNDYFFSNPDGSIFIISGIYEDDEVYFDKNRPVVKENSKFSQFIKTFKFIK